MTCSTGSQFIKFLEGLTRLEGNKMNCFPGDQSFSDLFGTAKK